MGHEQNSAKTFDSYLVRDKYGGFLRGCLNAFKRLCEVNAGLCLLDKIGKEEFWNKRNMSK